MNIQSVKSGFQTLPPRLRKRLIWFAALLLAYTLIGFFILPLIIWSVATKQLSALFDREVTIQKVRINPFAFSGAVRGLLIKDKDGEPLVSWDEAYANFQLVSFLGRPWVFKEIRLVKPYARIQLGKDRSLNFSDLLEKFGQASPEPAKPGKPLALRVSQLQIIGASASFTDLTPLTPFRRVLGPVEITLTKFETDPSSKNPYAFSGTTDAGENFAWSGSFFLDPIRSEGELSFGGLALANYAPLYQDFLRFEFKDGVVDLRSTYRFGISATNYIAAVSNATFSLTSLKVAEKGSAENLVELDKLKVSGVTADAVARSADITSFFADGGRILLKRDRDEKLNVVEMARPADTATNAPGSIMMLLQAATNAFAFLLQSTNNASVVLHQLDVTNCSVVWEDSANARPVRLPVDQITVAARELSNHSGSNMTVTVSLRWNTNGTIRVDTTAQILPASADVTLALNDIELGPLDPYLEPFVNLFIIGSKVGLDGHIRLKTVTNELPDVTFTGDLRLDDFSTVDGVMANDLVKWKSIRFTGIDAKLVPSEVTVKEIALIEPYASVAVETNRVINVLAALKLGDTNAPTAAEKPVQPSPASNNKSGLNKQFGGFIRDTLASNTNAAGSPLAPKITVNSVVISNAALQFSDRSLSPRVSLSISDLNGTITDLSSEELKRADLHLAGKVGRSSPVEITGKINPLNQNASSEIKIAVHDVDLMPTSPYVGKFAGYRLNRGKLNLDLDYEITDRKLAAKNLIVLDQFTLGEKVNSPDATKLPVRLAVAVLKDREGKIELDVPVEGSLDDPQFRLGKVISRAIVNVITKIVTSPFAALGAIFGGKGEELSFQEFSPGSAALQTNAVEKLETLAKGLYERPGLAVEIEGSVDTVKDREALARQKLENELRVAKWTALRKSEQTRIKPEEIEITPEEFQEHVQRIYATAFSPEAVAARSNSVGQLSTALPASSEKAFRPAEIQKGAQRMIAGQATAPSLPPEEMQQQLFDFIEITDDDYRQLATRRAEQVKDFLLTTGKVEGERIFFTEQSEGAAAFKGSRAYIHLR